MVVKETILAKGTKSLFLINKRSPELLLFGGITGMFGSMFLSCKATLDVQFPIMETQMALAAIEKLKESDPDYSEEAYLRDRSIQVASLIKDLARAYGPAAVLAATSVAMLVGSNRILNARNAGLAAAYALVDEAYKRYRARVVDELGEDVDNYLRYKKPLEDANLQVLDGKKKVNFKDAENVDLPGELHDDYGRMPSPYAKFFNDSCPAWRKSNVDNEFFLKSQQNYANEMLQLRGHMFLNEVYDMIELPRTPEGAVVGWIHGSDETQDGFIDFNLYNDYNGDWINGYPTTQILLDFNVDGPIWNRF